MSMTRAQLTSMAREVADAVGSPRWSDSTIQSWLGLAQWQELGNLLNANRQYYMNVVQPYMDSNGRFLMSELTTGTGDSTKNFYRVLTMSQPNTSAATAQVYYRKVNYEEYPNPQPSTSLPYVWYDYGDEIQILPAVGGLQMNVVCNYRPARVDQLVADSSVVPFPDGYESLLALMAGARMLDKGGAEANAAAILRGEAEQIREQMLMDLGRRSTMPIIARAFDDPLGWGSAMAG